MDKLKLNLEQLLLKIQLNNNIGEVWQFFLEVFNINEVVDNSYLIVKSPFKHTKLNILNKQIQTTELLKDSFEMSVFDFSEKGYSFDKKKQQLSGHWSLSFSEIEFVIKTKNYNNIDIFEQWKNYHLLIVFFINHLNLLLHIEHLNMHSIKDDLTLLYNQNYLKSFIEREINRSKRFDLQFSVIFFDLDYLKDINEKHGHLVGTEVLKEVSRILKDSIRNIDVVARFGGDEFVIVLSDSEPELALQISKRLREKIKNNSFLKEDGLDLKISGCFGIANFPEHGDSVKELIRKSDMAMYEVKRSGKDGIKVYKGD